MRTRIHKLISLLAAFCLTGVLYAQEAVEPNAPQAIRETALQVRGQSFFTDRVIRTYVLFDSEVEPPERPYPNSESVQIVSIEVQATPDSEQSKSIAAIQFLARESGLVSLPSLRFTSGDTIYTTNPVSIRVQTPQQAEQMSLRLQPSKQQVYAGEPLRMDLSWEAKLDASALRALRLYPDFFDNPDIEVVIPRNTDPEDKQVGLPIGGRRVIASRTKAPGQPKWLGSIELPIFLRFKTPGEQALSETYLEVAQLDKAGNYFARYAAYFNNGLFEMPDRDDAYGRIFTTAPGETIQVLPLPEAGRRASFSGLFAPVEIEVTAEQSEVAIGEPMELKVLVKSPAPHGMLELPDFSRQANLRERFVVDNDHGRLWNSEGTEFRIRVRPLTTSIRAIPPLHFQLFNPDSGQYEMRQSAPIPLKVNQVNGVDYLPLGSIEGASVPLTDQPDGIWHNLSKNPMNDRLNALHCFANDYFWWLLVLGPIAFGLLRPLVLHWRRRATDPSYRRRVEAYADFKRAPGDSKEKWGAFVRYLARSFDGNEKAWTRHDSEKALRAQGLDEADIQEIIALHEAADAKEYGGKDPTNSSQHLVRLAKRIRQLNLSAVLILFLALSLLPHLARADNWTHAESLRTAAQSSDAGSDRAMELYQESALRFEAAASANKHTGEAWYNAGNAWFQAGAIGRSIAAYRQASAYLPFNPQLADNLEAARALTLNQVPNAQTGWQRIPQAWVASMLVGTNLIFWAMVLFWLRYRTRAWKITTAASAILLLALSALWLQKRSSKERMGVVVVDETIAKKGPGYAYADAFNEPLYDGLEFILREQRDGWARIELTDGRTCWLPIEQAVISNDL